MNAIAQINDTQVSIINFKSVPVVTTAMLADFYQSLVVRLGFFCGSVKNPPFFIA